MPMPQIRSQMPASTEISGVVAVSECANPVSAENLAQLADDDLIAMFLPGIAVKIAYFSTKGFLLLAPDGAT